MATVEKKTLYYSILNIKNDYNGKIEVSYVNLVMKTAR